MTARMKSDADLLPDVTKGIGSLPEAIGAGGLPAGVQELTAPRVSQINGCSACGYSHLSSARRAGERDERVFTVSAWREAPFWTGAEGAALELAETAARVADLSRDGVPDPSGTRPPPTSTTSGSPASSWPSR